MTSTTYFQMGLAGKEVEGRCRRKWGKGWKEQEKNFHSATLKATTAQRNFK